jgi:hypothetical protein
MAVNFLKKNPNGASPGDKVRGVITIALTLLSWTLAYNATDAQWQGTFLVAGILYFVTMVAIVFKDV